MNDQQRWEYLKRIEPRLGTIERRIDAVRAKNKEVTGNARPSGHFAENVWVGYGTQGIWDQIQECVGRYSNNPKEALQDDEVFQFCHDTLLSKYMAIDPDKQW